MKPVVWSIGHADAAEGIVDALAFIKARRALPGI
jgi:hypothetical protein